MFLPPLAALFRVAAPAPGWLALAALTAALMPAGLGQARAHRAWRPGAASDQVHERFAARVHARRAGRYRVELPLSR